MRKNILAMSAMTLVVLSGSAAAAATNGQLTFNWQGVVPTAPVTSGAWAFVDGLDIPFTPVTEALNIVSNAASVDITALKPTSFFIVPVTGPVTAGVPVTRNTTGTVNSINAFLGSAPVSGGFVGNKQLNLSTATTPAVGEVAITLNGQSLKVGSASPLSVTPSAAAGSETPIEISMSAKAAPSDVTDGAAVSFTAPVVFAVDI
ncbi:Cro/Cl family transcriptional regulator [Salmonella enterica]|uniref:Cro/Cl family transcriptional regulator n=1 Tax=Salmonella enterica TaxID=28901 RepID=A0A5T4LNA2_SALER|nr:Cro/Cl family transcriptional regulator [Salmonella enterica]EBL7518565.1 Cro/Cl family transcriptional regulator [Salmonella enterica]